ncbi:MAG: LLM class F420-dependent oxidoreductase [Aggregatilineales bacterium]
MKLGVVLPSGEIDNDPIVIRDFVQAVEGMGFDYLLTYELLTDSRSDTAPSAYPEPLTLLSYIAGVAQKLELATGIIVLPSRQTILVAKQAAQLDILTNGKLRLGVSTGWNDAEYAALNIPLAGRGQRMDEQIRLLRRLWTEQFPTFDGDYHTLENIGVFPKPIQQPIPIWIGGYAETVFKRVGELGDGWLAYDETPASIQPKLDKIKQYALKAGRDPDTIGLNIVGIDITKAQDWAQLVTDWQNAGAGYLDVSTRGAGFTTSQHHLDALRTFKESIP